MNDCIHGVDLVVLFVAIDFVSLAFSYTRHLQCIGGGFVANVHDGGGSNLANGCFSTHTYTLVHITDNDVVGVGVR